MSQPPSGGRHRPPRRVAGPIAEVLPRDFDVDHAAVLADLEHFRRTETAHPDHSVLHEHVPQIGRDPHARLDRTAGCMRDELAAGTGHEHLRVHRVVRDAPRVRARGVLRRDAPIGSVDRDDLACAAQHDVHEARVVGHRSSGLVAGLQSDRGEDVARAARHAHEIAIGIRGEAARRTRSRRPSSRPRPRRRPSARGRTPLGPASRRPSTRTPSIPPRRGSSVACACSPPRPDPVRHDADDRGGAGRDPESYEWSLVGLAESFSETRRYR